MSYSEDPGHVRADRYKLASGKWYDTFAIDMNPYYNTSNIHEAVKRAVIDRAGNGFDLDDWIIVVHEPYHKYAHPVMLKKFEPDA